MKYPSPMIRLALVASLFTVAMLPATSAHALVQATIAVDGDTADWSVVLADPDNVLPDRIAAEGDPDQPSNNRDLRTFAATWDAENLYLFFRRVGGKSSVTYLAYVEGDDDGLLEGSDLVLALKFNGAKAQSAAAYFYDPAGGSDPVTGDGVDEPGSLGNATATDLTGRATADGREVEARVSWAALGLPPGSTLQFHASISRGTNLPSQVEDNAGPFVTRTRTVRLERDGDAATSSPGSVLHPHVVTATGNQTDLFNLSATSQNGFAVEFLTDPNRDGNPGDGVSMATDGDGDGDFGSGADALDPAFDRDGDGYPDTGYLTPPGSFAFVLRVSVPGGVATGTEDLLRLTAVSSADPLVAAANIDRTVVGALSISPDLVKTAVSGTTVWYGHRVCNFSGLTDSVALTATSARGWPVELWSDPNGDGNPSDGVLITSTAPIADGTCVAIVATLDVPAGTAVGTADTVTVGGVLNASPGITDTATDRVTVTDRITFAPDRAGFTGPGGTVFYAAVLTNNWSTSGNFDLTVSTSLGSRIGVWSDPNGDGNPGDGRLIALIGPVAPNGGQAHVVIEVTTPGSASPGDVDLTVVTATLRGDPSVSAAVRDTTTVRGIQVFEDPAFAIPGTLFDLCGTVYALGSGLDPRERYRFVWYDALGVLRRTSSGNGDFPDNNGQLADSFPLGAGDPGGTWQARLQYRQGGNFIDVTPGGVAEFLVTDDSASEGGVFTALVTDKSLYTLAGDSLSARADLENPSSLVYRSSNLEYVLFRDVDGDGRPTGGESYITPSGIAAAWSAGSMTCGPNPVPTLGQGGRFSDATCQVSNIQFTATGAWRLCATWRSSCGTEAARACAVIAAGTSPGCAPFSDAGPDRVVCDGDSTMLGSTTNPALIYEWSPELFLDDPSLPRPVATPEYGLDYVLTVTDPATGCVSSSAVRVSVSVPRRPDAGANRSTCAGGGSIIGTDPGAGWACSWAPATGLSSTTACQPFAAPLRTTVYEVRWTDLASGCSDTDAMVFITAPVPPANAGPDRFICSTWGGALIGTPAQAGFAYSWTPVAGLSDANVAQPFARPAATTVYTVTVTDLGHGCSATDSVTVSTAGPLGSAGAGPLVAPARLGTTCDPGLVYQWSPSAGLDDASACNPIASPTVDTTYCLTVIDRTSGCASAPSCVLVRVPNCPAADRPRAIQRLVAAKAGGALANVLMRWQTELLSVSGYHGYAVTAKQAIAAATSGRRAFTTAASRLATIGQDIGRVPGPGGEIFFYQVVGICQDGATEGDM